MDEMKRQRDEAEGVILDKNGARWFRGTKLEDHEYVEDGIIYEGEKVEPVVKTRKTGERRPRRTFKDVQEAIKGINESLDASYWAVETSDGIRIVNQDDTVVTLGGENKKIERVLDFLTGFTYGLEEGKTVDEREVA